MEKNASGYEEIPADLVEFRNQINEAFPKK